MRLRRFNKIALAVWLAAAPLLWAPAVAGEETVTLFVELRDSGRDLRAAERAVRRMSERAPRDYRADEGVVTARDLRRWRVIEVAMQEIESVMEALRANPAVASVHEERLYHAAFVPSDPQYAAQYGLAAINAPAAWERTKGSAATVIAIIDGGVDLTHEDLRDKVWVNGGETAGNGLDDDGNGYVDDVHGWDFVADAPAGASGHHATHVAGIAAAAGDNGVGVAGVDWGARIMSVRVLSGGGVGREENIIHGIDYAVAAGADIINMSIVGPDSPALLDAIENTYAAGVVVVAAAGNSGIDTGRGQIFPACADVGGVNMVVGVGATDEEGAPASFSNFGGCVDVSAPGKNIVSTKLNNRYGKMTGTSMSSPFVAGVAGLYVAVHPKAEPAEIIAAVSAGEPIGDYGNRLDAAAVVGPVKSASPADHEASPEEPTSSGGGGSSGGDSGGGDSGGSSGDGGPSTRQPGGQASSGQASLGSGRVVGAISPKANVALLKRVKLTFNYVFGRYPTPAERLYWDTRVKKGEKRTYEALLGAMQWQKAKGLTGLRQGSGRQAEKPL